MKSISSTSRRGLLLSISAAALLLLQSCSLFSRVPGMGRLTGEEGVFRDRQAEYLEAETIPRTEIPEGLDSFVIDDLLVIPEIPGAPDQAFLDAPRPRELAGSSEREVVIQRMEERSWIVVDVSPSQVWPRIRDYWRAEGVGIAVENPTSGIMETEWFVREGNVLTQDRVRVIVETGFQNDSAEIRLVQMSQPQLAPTIGVVNWPEASQEPTVEAEMVTDMSRYLADVANLYTASSVSLLAGSISSEGKATLQTAPGGDSYLRLQAPFDRSWAAVGRALLRARIAIESQDADTGIYVVSYVPGSEDAPEPPGFFKRVFTLNGLLSGDDIPEAVTLRVHVRQQAANADGGIEVRVEPGAESATPQDEEAAALLLNLIRNTIA